MDNRIEQAAKDYLRYVFDPTRPGYPPNTYVIPHRLLYEVRWLKFWMGGASQYAGLDPDEILTTFRELYTAQAIRERLTLG